MLENIKIVDGKATLDISKQNLTTRVARLAAVIAELDSQQLAIAEKKADLEARKTTLEALVSKITE